VERGSDRPDTGVKSKLRQGSYDHLARQHDARAVLTYVSASSGFLELIVIDPS
jgi:hypothetical protein